MASGPRPGRRLATLGGAAAVAVVALLGLAAQENHPARIDVQRPPPARHHGRIVAVDRSGALVADADGTIRAVDADGRVAWRADTAEAAAAVDGGVRCAGCPAALGLDPLRTIAADGTVADPGWLAGATPYGGLYLTPAGRRLAVAALGPQGPVALGTVAARSLDPAAYGFAPTVAVGADGRSAAVVVGADDPLAVGRADAVLLRAGAPPLTTAVELADPGRAPVPCTPDGSDRWGWVDAVAGEEPWLGTATFTPAGGAEAGPPVHLDHPYSACVATADGFVLTAGNSGIDGTYPAVAWLDGSGRIRREEHRVGRDPAAVLSVARTGRVVVPSGDGFDVLSPSGTDHHLVADDARVATEGTVWVLRGTVVRRWTP